MKSIILDPSDRTIFESINDSIDWFGGKFDIAVIDIL